MGTVGAQQTPDPSPVVQCVLAASDLAGRRWLGERLHPGWRWPVSPPTPRLCDICSHAGAEPLASGGVSTGRQSCPWSCHPGQRFPTPKSNRDPRTLATPNGGVFDTLSRRGLVADGRLGGSEDCSETPSRDPTLTREVPWSPCEATGSVAGKALCPGACACSSVCSCASDLCDTEGRVRCSVSGACLCVQKQ